MTNAVTIKHNPIYKLRGDSCTDRYLMLFGGAGSGKSVYAYQRCVLDWFLQSRGEKVWITRKYATSLKNSVWAPIEQLLKNIGLWGSLKVNKTDRTIEFPELGNSFIFTGLDDVEKIKSIFGITKVWIEELTELEEDDFLQLDLRLRGELDNNFFQILSSFNPTSDKHWLVPYVEPQYLKSMPAHIADLEYLNKRRSAWRFATEDKEEGLKTYTTTINTTYKDNLYIDKQYIARLRTLASFDENYYQVYERGRWGILNGGDLYASQFREAIHVADVVKLDEQQSIHFTCDFNVKPHMTGLLAQIEYKEQPYKNHHSHYEVRINKEYALKYPYNEAHFLGEYVVNDYSYYMTNGVYLYGDASGNNRIGIGETKSLFHDVEKGFGEWMGYVDKRIPTTNPRYDKIARGALGRRMFLNAILSGAVPVKLIIHRDCTELITDLRLCQMDTNGRLAKPKNKDGYEERGHALQALEYLLCHEKSLGYLALI